MKTINELLKSKQRVVGTFCQIGSPETVEIVAAAGFQFAILDMEHGHFGIDTVANLVRAADARSMPSIIRVPDNRSELILRALDLGAGGVLVPQVASKEAARQAVQAAKYYPQGDRGACPFIRATNHYTADWQQYSCSANQDTTIMLLLEGGVDMGELEGIITTPNLDAVMVGPFDLSVSMGVGGQLDHPLVLEHIEHLANLCVHHDVALCIPTFDADLDRTKKRLADWSAIGCNNFCVGTDRMLLSQHLQTVMFSVKE